MSRDTDSTARTIYFNAEAFALRQANERLAQTVSYLETELISALNQLTSLRRDIERAQVKIDSLNKTVYPDSYPDSQT